jgi:hypothetical protein
MNCQMRKKVAPNTHHLDSDIQFLLMDFNWNWLVPVEYVTDKLVHLRKMQIICRKRCILQLFLKQQCHVISSNFFDNGI